MCDSLYVEQPGTVIVDGILLHLGISVFSSFIIQEEEQRVKQVEAKLSEHPKDSKKKVGLN